MELGDKKLIVQRASVGARSLGIVSKQTNRQTDKQTNKQTNNKSMMYSEFSEMANFSNLPPFLINWKSCL